MPDELEVDDPLDQADGDRAILDAEDEEQDDGNPEDEVITEEEEEESEESEEESEEEDEETEEESEEEGEEKDKEEDDEKKDDEDEDKAAAGRPTIRDIKKEFPEFFKKFPEMRDVYFREQKYRETFPTIESAQEASQKAAAFDEFDESLTNGDPTLLVNELDKNNPRALLSIAERFLPTLLEKDTRLYTHAVAPALESFVRALHEQGTKSKDKNMIASALYASHFLTGKYEIPAERNAGPTRREKELEEQLTNNQKERFQAAQSEIQTEFEADITKDIKASLKDVKATDWLKNQIVKDTLSALDAELNKDVRLRQSLQGLFKAAKRNGYRKGDIASIKSALLARAKVLLPGIRTRIRNEALGSSESKGKQKQAPQKRNVPSGMPAGKGSRIPSAREMNWGAYRDKDPDRAILDGDFRVRGAKKK